MLHPDGGEEDRPCRERISPDRLPASVAPGRAGPGGSFSPVIRGEADPSGDPECLQQPRSSGIRRGCGRYPGTGGTILPCHGTDTVCRRGYRSRPRVRARTHGPWRGAHVCRAMTSCPFCGSSAVYCLMDTLHCKRCKNMWPEDPPGQPVSPSGAAGPLPAQRKPATPLARRMEARLAECLKRHHGRFREDDIPAPADMPSDLFRRFLKKCVHDGTLDGSRDQYGRTWYSLPAGSAGKPGAVPARSGQHSRGFSGGTGTARTIGKHRPFLQNSGSSLPCLHRDGDQYIAGSRPARISGPGAGSRGLRQSSAVTGRDRLAAWKTS